MADTAQRKPWHICHDCLDPIADGLQKIGSSLHRLFPWERYTALRNAQRELYDSCYADRSRLPEAQQIELVEIEAWLDRIGSTPPEAADISRLYERHHLAFAVTYLKITVSVEFARELERRLLRHQRKLARLEFRACHLGTETPEGQPVRHVPFALYDLLETHSENVRRLCRQLKQENPDREIERPTADEMPNEPGMADFEREFREPFDHMPWAIRKTVLFLRQASSVLKAKLAKRPVEEDDLPDEEADGHITIAQIESLTRKSASTLRNNKFSEHVQPLSSAPGKASLFSYCDARRFLLEKWPDLLAMLPETYKEACEVLQKIEMSS